MSAERIRELNDQLRRTFQGGKVVITEGIDALPRDVRVGVMLKIAWCAEFSPENDPYGEHDFGSVEVDGHKVLWKIDAYNADMTGGSEDPTDPSKTTRVITIMLASEY